MAVAVLFLAVRPVAVVLPGAAGAGLVLAPRGAVIGPLAGVAVWHGRATRQRLISTPVRRGAASAAAAAAAAAAAVICIYVTQLDCGVAVLAMGSMQRTTREGMRAGPDANPLKKHLPGQLPPQ